MINVFIGMGKFGRILQNIKGWYVAGVANPPFMYSVMSSIIFPI